MIELACFDVGGTLIEPYPSVGDVYARAGREFGLDASPAEIEAAFARAWAGRGRIAADWRTIVEAVFEDIAFRGDREGCFHAFYDAFAKKDAWRVFEDVIETLDALDVRGVRMGVLSNWDERLKPLLEALGLLRRFDPVLVSSEVGLAKPDPEFFRLAAERAGVPIDRVLHVGDDVALDLVPANALGMRALLIDRQSKHTAPAGSAIASLTELVRHLG